MLGDWQLRFALESLENRRTGCAFSLALNTETFRIKHADDLQEIETITLKGRYPLSIGLARLPQSSGEECGSGS